MLEQRARRAALEVFGERGWAGMTIDEIATRARVGKSSIYLRWQDKTMLLADALREVLVPPAAGPAQDGEIGGRPEGVPGEASEGHKSLRDYLIAHALRRANLYLGPYGVAVLRLYVETRALPDVFAEIRQGAITDVVLAERHRVEEAIQHGDLPPSASTVQILDAIEGAVFVHVLVTPPHLMDRVRRNLRGYVEQLVDNQLRAASGCWLTPPDS
jgi:AcrR family transcriptional regulator